MRPIAIAIVIALALGQRSFAQTPAPPSKSPPASQPDQLEPYRRSTVAVGQIINDGNGTKFRTVGSAVIVARDQNHAVLITAKHVFFEPSIGYIPTQVNI